MPVESVPSVLREEFLASPPPRVVPEEIVRKVMPLSAVGLKLAWCAGALVLGLLLTVFLVPRNLIDQWRLDHGKVETTSGKILTAGETDTKVNRSRVWEYEFSHSLNGGAEWKGTAYTAGRRWEPGQVVEIRRLADDPGVAVPTGARLDPTPVFMASILIFPLLGTFGIISTVVERGWKKRLLRDGLVGEATVDAVEKSRFGSEGEDHYKLRLTRGDGVRIRTRTSSIAEINVAHARLKSGRPLTILYHRNKRNRFLIVDGWDANAAKLPPERYFRGNPVSAVLPAVNPAAERLTAAFLDIPAPRKIPWEIKRKAVPVDDMVIVQLVGAVFFSFGAWLSWMILPFFLPVQLLLDAGPSRTVPGEILSVKDPGIIADNEKVSAYRFRYKPEGSPEREGTAYKSGGDWTVGEPVTVRYLPFAPSQAVPEGGWMGVVMTGRLVVLFFPLIGGLMLFGPVFFRARKTHLLRMGQVASAKITSVERTTVKVNNESVYKIGLEWDGVGIVKRSWEAREIAFAMRKWQAREPVMILYLPDKPHRLLLPELWNEETRKRT